ncbi:MAG: class I SAM-dependent methyltransferase [bacterium]
MKNLQSALYSLTDTDPAPITDFIQWLAASYGLKGPLRVLDIGCGPGRMLGELARLGWKVWGMDPEPDFLESAEETARVHPDVRVLQGGFADIAQEDFFDLVAAINGPFSYLLTVEDRIVGLERAFRALRSQGVLFLETANPSWVLKHYREPEERTLALDGRAVRYRQRNEFDFHDNLWVQTDEFVLLDSLGAERRLSKKHTLAMVGLPQIAHLMRRQGFADLQTFNSYGSRSSERLTGGRLMLAARRPA